MKINSIGKMEGDSSTHVMRRARAGGGLLSQIPVRVEINKGAYSRIVIKGNNYEKD